MTLRRSCGGSFDLQAAWKRFTHVGESLVLAVFEQPNREHVEPVRLRERLGEIGSSRV